MLYQLDPISLTSFGRTLPVKRKKTLYSSACRFGTVTRKLTNFTKWVLLVDSLLNLFGKWQIGQLLHEPWNFVEGPFFCVILYVRNLSINESTDRSWVDEWSTYLLVVWGCEHKRYASVVLISGFCSWKRPEYGSNILK